MQTGSLRSLLGNPGPILCPGAYDAFSAAPMRGRGTGLPPGTLLRGQADDAENQRA